MSYNHKPSTDKDLKALDSPMDYLFITLVAIFWIVVLVLCVYFDAYIAAGIFLAVGTAVTAMNN
jgi:energy-converting hydrogenase Eha subunit C